MGLVAFSPIEQLLSPPGDGAGKASGSQALPGAFTDLLAALLAAVPGEPGDTVAHDAGSNDSLGSLLALLNPGHAKDDDNAKGIPAVAALVASFLQPPALPVDVSIAVKGSVDPATAAVAGAVPIAAPSDVAPAALPGPISGDAEAETATAPAVAADTGPSVDALPAPPVVDTPLLAAPAVAGADSLASPTSPAPSTTPDATPVATVSPPIAAAAETTRSTGAEAAGQVEPPPPGHGPVEVKATGRPDTAGPPPTVTFEQGVVRFVGNARKGQHEGQHDGPDLPEHERGVPRASTQAIAHASDNSAVAQLRTPAPDSQPVDQVAPPPAPVEQPQAVEQVAHAVIEKVEAGGGEAHIRLDPPELGEVTIHVKISGGHVRLDVHAERTETMQLLRDQALDLASLLNGRGLDLSDVYVGLGGRQAPDARGDEDSTGRQRQGQGDEFAALLGIDEEPPAADRFNRLRAVYNPDGAHVYRI